MSKYQPLSERLAAHPDPEWRTSFSELEAVLGFPLPKAARTGRAWWANDPEKSHSRAWAVQGWEVGDVDHAAEQVVFRKGAASAATLVAAAALQPLKQAAPLRRRRPEELAALAAERPEEGAEVEAARAEPRTSRSPARALGATALVTAGLAVVAGLGAALLGRSLRRR